MTAQYDAIGCDYDLTRRADPYLAARMAHWLTPHTNGKYLDVACGTGNYTVALANRGGRWWGVDVSSTMIEQARTKSAATEWTCASAERLPWVDGFFDGASCTLALHHLGALEDTFREVRRVLGRGTLVVFTSTPEQMRGYWLNAYFPEAMRRSIEQMPCAERVEEACLRAGFERVVREPYFVQPDLVDGFLYSGKLRPRVYLDERMRAGSSTFRTLADPRELREGVAHLQHDLETGHFARVFAKYENLLGDYLFLGASTA